MPDAFWNAATKPSAMYSGQFEIRTVPDAAAPSSGGVDADGLPLPPLLSDPHAASTEGPRASAAAAAAPPPMKRRRDVRLVASRSSSAGLNASMFLAGMATVPFVY
jgi:hypothetical protein